MNFGESLLAIGAMVLLSILVLSTNNTIFSTGTSLNESKFDLLATSIGTSIIEEASNKSFDENTIDTTASKTSDLSIKLGPEGETRHYFDDFDDYNGCTGSDSTMPSAVFNYRCKVEYVVSGNPEKISASRTWDKKLTVYVTSKSMQDTVKLCTVFSYWYFR
jgi:hypothetical protein